MKRIRTVASVLALIALSSVAAAAQDSGAEIIYIENPSGDILITDPNGIPITPDFGVMLAEGSRIETGAGALELRLEPSGTVLKLAEDTLFELRALQGGDPEKETVFALLRGKMRTLAARISGAERYSVHTPSAICAVRGTEFINEVGESGSSILVREGSVYVEALAGDRWVTLGANQGLDTRARAYRPVTLPVAEIEALFAAFDFRGTAPGGPFAPTGSASGDIGRPVTEAVGRRREYETKSYDERSAFGRWMADSLAGEIGTITIDGETYSKLVLSPLVEAGSFRAAFYLPIIYVDLFDGGTWYRPRGNNEWSFGADQDSGADIALDLWTDLWLKVRYVEYGDAGWDPFYVKLGNLDAMTLGRGALFDGYANNYDFPAIRRLGLNMGLDRRFGVEVLMDDLARPNLGGLRVSWNPLDSGFELGLTGAADLRPLADRGNSGELGDPWLVAGGLDADLFEINRERLKLAWFTDASAMLPVYREATSGPYAGVSSGAAWDVLWNDDRPTNFVLRTGVRGVLGPIRYGLDYRFWNGVAVPSLFDSAYGRLRTGYVADYTAYLNGTTVPGDHMGVYGEAYWDILDNERLSLGAAYDWPWDVGSDGASYDTDDYLKVELAVGRRLIRAYGVHGALRFERRRVRQTVSRPDDYSWFDGFTVISGEIVFPLNPILEVALIGGTTTAYDDDGNIIWTDAPTNTVPKVTPLLNIETRINY